ncbi:MAG: class I SAM-dependent methyltransferase, partial [Acidimicrobiales bacterium]
MRVLELGPLEGGHSYMLDCLGASGVTAIEANQRAYLRCLIAKELLGIPSARFLCGDFMAYLQDAVRRGASWDLCVAVGVLYHQKDPVSLLELATQVSDRLLLWTHYYDAEVIGRRPELAANFPSAERRTAAGFAHVLHRHE